MFIKSINIAKPTTIQFNEEDVLTGIFKQPLQGEIQITEFGILGDNIIDKTVHGGLDQAIYLYHMEDYIWWSEKLGRPLGPGSFGENLTVSGLADHDLVIGDRLLINDVELEISAPRTPCFKLAVRMGDNGFVKAFAKAQRSGAYARVIKAGTLNNGDAINLLPTTENYATVKEVFVEWHQKEHSLAILSKALASPLATVHKQKLQQWYNEAIKE